MEGFVTQFLDSLGSFLPSVLIAIVILVGGWLLAVIIAAIVRGLLRRLKVDERITKLIQGEEEAEKDQVRVTFWVGRIVFWLILLFAVVGFLQALNLTAAAEPINALLNQILGYLPLLLGAGALILVAWIIASALRFLIVRLLQAAKLDERISSQAEVELPEESRVSTTIGNAVYWLVFLLFLPAVLDALNLQGLLGPVQGMVNEILGFLPNLFAAAVILLVGWIVARIVRQILVNTLASLGVDRFGERVGFEAGLGGLRLSTFIGTLVYVLILIPIAISALNVLQIEAVSGPASEMLTTVLLAIPSIFAAFLLIGIAYFVARFLGTFVTNILTGLGFNKVLTWIGLGAEPVEGRRTPSEIVGYLVVVGIMFFAVIEGANLLGFTILADLASQFLVAAGNVLLGLVIFGLGLYLASLAEGVIRDTVGSQANILAPTARIAIIVFTAALGLRQFGIAQDIVNLAFGIVLGAVALIAVLAFGLGGRDLAARELEKWLSSFREPK